MKKELAVAAGLTFVLTLPQRFMCFQRGGKSRSRPALKRDGHNDVTTLAAVPDPRKAACLGGKAH